MSAAPRAPALPRRGERARWILEDAGVSRLRRQIMAVLGPEAAAGADLGAAEVVIGELLSNAVAHAGGRAWVALCWDGPHPLLSVADRGPGFPAGAVSVDADRNLVVRLPDDPLAESGRGLFLVSRLALDVAVVARAGGGTVVSVVLDLRRAG